MEKPDKLFHTTPTATAEIILREGLKPWPTYRVDENGEKHDAGLQPVNLSTDDETELVAFFGEANGCIDEDGHAVDTVTVLEVDTRGITLEWPGQDGPHHFVCYTPIPPERIKVVRVATIDEVQEGYEGQIVDPDTIKHVLEAMTEAGQLALSPKVLE